MFLFVSTILSIAMVTGATEKAHHRQEDGAFAVCSQEEYYEWYYNKYPPKCRFLLENLDFDEERFLVYCHEECGPPYLDFLRSCDFDKETIDYYGNLCYENNVGIPCSFFFLSEESLQHSYHVENNCETSFQNGTNCTVDCFLSLHQFRNALGCCVNNVYNHTGGINMAVGYGVWSKCGVSTPGVCSSACETVISSAFVLMSALVTLISMNLIV